MGCTWATQICRNTSFWAFKVLFWSWGIWLWRHYVLLGASWANRTQVIKASTCSDRVHGDRDPFQKCFSDHGQTTSPKTCVIHSESMDFEGSILILAPVLGLVLLTVYVLLLPLSVFLSDHFSSKSAILRNPKGVGKRGREESDITCREVSHDTVWRFWRFITL